MLSGKFQSSLMKHSKRKLVELGILEPVTDHTDWVNSHVIVKKDAPIYSSNHHAPNHSIKRKLRICLDPRDLNEALERERAVPHMLYQ